MNLREDLKVGQTGDVIRLLHSELLDLGLEVPVAEQRGAEFGPGTQNAVTQFQRENGIKQTGVVDAATAKLIDQKLNQQTAAAFLVSGQVYAPRAGVGGLNLLVVDKNAGPDVTLATGVADVRGSYAIRYSVAPVKAAGKRAPDIQVQVLAGDKWLASSEVRYNASAGERINVYLPEAAAAALPSEFETLSRDVTAHFRGRLADLQESGARTDVTYLANKTGWDARAVAMASLADQFSASRSKGTVPPSFFYALFRAGVPANDDILFHAAPATLRAIWTQAADGGVIPRADAKSIGEAVQRFQALSADRMLAGPAAIGPSAVKDLLALSNLGAAEQRRFVELFAAQRTNPTELWEQATEALGAPAITRLRTAGKLAFLTINNAPLMKALIDTGGPLELVRAGFHRAAAWQQVLGNAPVPKEIPGDTDTIRRARYAEYLATQLRVSFPTAAIAQMVQSGELPVRSAPAVAKFLIDQQGMFEIGAQPVAQFIATNKLSVDTTVVAELKRLQRVYQITADDAAMGALLKKGLDAAYHIVKLEEQTFVRLHAADLGGEEAARAIHRRSTQIHGAVLNIATSYLTARNGIAIGNARLLATDGAGGQMLMPKPNHSLPAANGGGAEAADVSDLVVYPTLETLFGSMDFCSCEECRSILSPAAYLVDLLLFLDQDPPPGGSQNPQTVLLDRRPDIEHLPLTCENTNTAMPYIDLVNETLEYYIANTVLPLSLEDYQGHDTGASVTEDLLTVRSSRWTRLTTLQSELFPLIPAVSSAARNAAALLQQFDVPLAKAMEAPDRQPRGCPTAGATF